MATAVVKEEPELNEIQILDPSNFHIELLNPSELTSEDQIINIKVEPQSDADQMVEFDQIDSQPESKKIKSEYPESDQVYVIDMNDTRYKIIIVKEEANAGGTEIFPGAAIETLDSGSVSNHAASSTEEKTLQNKVSVEWTYNQTKLLLKTKMDMAEQCIPTGDSSWADVASVMTKSGHNVTAADCETHYTELCNLYQTNRFKAFIAGEHTIVWPHFDVMKEIDELTKQFEPEASPSSNLQQRPAIDLRSILDECDKSTRKRKVDNDRTEFLNDGIQLLVKEFEATLEQIDSYMQFSQKATALRAKIEQEKMELLGIHIEDVNTEAST
ncbi:uncharacterized protein LOC131929009 [Physella acuta]|uniref:uncharacterized protein LOC131929009 n=1 Tax=Physella acuta TaxID=109671 RepID=UPI0027DDDE57|nr:uncharacterized protein LOC131929009 [Physella acuta]